jgi:hypothetical protein
MAKVFPSDTEINLVIADDVRQEVNNKISILGYYIGNTMHLKDVGPSIAVPLTFMVILLEGEGTFKFKMDFFSPSGNPIFQGPEADVVKEPGKASVSIAKFGNFPAGVVGKYRIDVYLDGKKYSRELTVGHDPTIQST